VIYVMGAGRSGSTVLGVALGNCRGVLFAGELNEWSSRAGVPPLDDPRRQQFWREVNAGVNMTAELRHGAARRMERSSALFQPKGWLARRRLRRPYREVARQLYESIANTAGASFVVDTSHYPLRAREVLALDEVDAFLVYLVRDPRSVVASLGRTDVPERTFGKYTANAYLWLTNTLSLLVFLRQPRNRRLLVRHEDFIENPGRVVGRILAGAGSDASPSVEGALSTGVPFHGNRLIRSEAITLTREHAKVARAALLTSVLQLPWRMVFAMLRPSTAAPARIPPCRC